MPMSCRTRKRQRWNDSGRCCPSTRGRHFIALRAVPFHLPDRSIIVPYAFLTLEEALRDLPTLRGVLGQRWIDRESNTPPLESTFPLARTLRIKELSHLHATLDQRLSDLWAISGAEDWRNRLRSDGPGFRELQTELAFADFLQQRGYEFDHPEQGPDFSIILGDDPPLLIEATTPRVIAWDDDLNSRLQILSRQFEHSVQ